MKDMPAYKTMDEYIALFPAEVQSILNKIRALIRSIAPEAGEKSGTASLPSPSMATWCTLPLMSITSVFTLARMVLKSLNPSLATML